MLLGLVGKIGHDCGRIGHDCGRIVLFRFVLFFRLLADLKGAGHAYGIMFPVFVRIFVP